MGVGRLAAQRVGDARQIGATIDKRCSVGERVLGCEHLSKDVVGELADISERIGHGGDVARSAACVFRYAAERVLDRGDEIEGIGVGIARRQRVRSAG